MDYRGIVDSTPSTNYADEALKKIWTNCQPTNKIFVTAWCWTTVLYIVHWYQDLSSHQWLAVTHIHMKQEALWCKAGAKTSDEITYVLRFWRCFSITHKPFLYHYPNRNLNSSNKLSTVAPYTVDKTKYWQITTHSQSLVWSWCVHNSTTITSERFFQNITETIAALRTNPH